MKFFKNGHFKILFEFAILNLKNFENNFNMR